MREWQRIVNGSRSSLAALVIVVLSVTARSAVPHPLAPCECPNPEGAPPTSCECADPEEPIPPHVDYGYDEPQLDCRCPLPEGTPPTSCECPNPEEPLPSHFDYICPDGTGFIGPDRARLPANAAGVLWHLSRDPRPHENIAGNFTVEVLQGGRSRQLPVRVSRLDAFSRAGSHMYLVAPAGDGLRPGSKYVFAVYSDSREDTEWVVATVDREPLSATAAFELDVGPVRNEVVRVYKSTPGVTLIDVSLVPIEGRLPQGAEPWRKQLLYRTIIDDGLHWRARDDHPCFFYMPGRTKAALVHDHIYAECSATGTVEAPLTYMPLAPGRHTLRMEAHLPGTGVVLTTGVKSVDLTGCEDRDGASGQ